MTRIRLLLMVPFLFGTVAATPLTAQEHFRSITLSGGISGSIDEDDTGFSNAAFQVRFAVETSSRTNLGVRLGRMDFGDEQVNQSFGLSIDYLSVVGEYIFDEPSHDSGLYLGLGFFDLSASRLDGSGSSDEGSVGGVIGALGEFNVGERWFIYGEAFGAYTGLDVAQIFASLQVGVGYRF